eukprot:m.469242 g.469242  ORF g.469242 m.469242 type:complete len:110 (+) comp21649_c0_seq30:3119-3448(+)
MHAKKSLRCQLILTPSRISDADRVLVYGSVITLSREWVQSMVTVTNTTNLAIYGLNTLMKRQPSPVKNWSMVVFPDHPDWNVPSLIPHGGTSGNWNGRCNHGDCAMIVL